MAVKPLPSQETIRQLLDYDPETGCLTWKARTPDMFAPGRNSPEHRCRMFNDNFAGKPAFISRKAKGYLCGCIHQSSYLTHRVIWKLKTGRDPVEQIDHINGVRDDNRWCNLREATASQNRGNSGCQKNSKYSKFKGVCFATGTGLFTAAIFLEGKQRHIGSFRCETKAALAYDAAALKKYGEFARLNFPRGGNTCH